MVYQVDSVPGSLALPEPTGHWTATKLDSYTMMKGWGWWWGAGGSGGVVGVRTDCSGNRVDSETPLL